MKMNLLFLSACLVAGSLEAQTISVSPQAATVAVGATKQLTRSSSAAWSSSDTSVATVSSTGLVKAKRPGKATISVSLGGLVARSVITVPGVVVVTPPPPPPPDTAPTPPPVSSGVWRSHEPSGMNSFADQSFSSMSGWGSAGLSIANDATAPRSPPAILRVTYPGGSSGGSAPGYAEKTFSDSRVLYITYWAKLSSNFTGHPTGFNKQFYAWAGGAPIFFLDASGNENLIPRAVLQGTPADAVLAPNFLPTPSIPRGRWYNIEVLLIGNTSGFADGEVDWWLDGVPVGRRIGLRFTSGNTAWDTFTFRPVWGGQGGTVPATMTLDLDHVYLSGKN